MTWFGQKAFTNSSFSTKINIIELCLSSHGVQMAERYKALPRFESRVCSDKKLTSGCNSALKSCLPPREAHGTVPLFYCVLKITHRVTETANSICTYVTTIPTVLYCTVLKPLVHRGRGRGNGPTMVAVSYTHLTLPTIYSV